MSALRLLDAATVYDEDSMKPYLAMAALAALASAAFAEQPQTIRHPGDPSAPVPAVKYESAFTGYARHREEQPAPWRELNETVGKVGGHSGVFRGKTAEASRLPGHPAPVSPAPAGKHKGR